MYQRRVLEYLWGAPWPLLGVCDVGRESVFLDLAGVRWALRRLCEAQVGQALRVGEDQEMRHAQRAGDVHEILEVVPLLLLLIVLTENRLVEMLRTVIAQLIDLGAVGGTEEGIRK
jgi:hypothetical protein